MKGAAMGDSGGPLMIKEPVLQQGGYQSRWIAVGVVTGGNYINEKERDLLLWSHSLFARSSYYCDWIEDVTDGDAKCIEVLSHQPLTAKSTSTTIPSTKPTTSAVSKVVQYSGGCVDQIKKSCPMSKDDNRCAKGSDARYICPESCGVCAENGFPRPYPPNATCFDYEQRINYCFSFKDKGLCDRCAKGDPLCDSRYPDDYYRYWCAYTCGVC